MKIESFNVGFVPPHKVPFVKRPPDGGRMRGIMNGIKKWIAFSALCGFLACGTMSVPTVYAAADTMFTEEESSYIKNAGTLKVGYVQDQTPVSFQTRDNELGGISRYIFDRIEEISGLDFEYVALPIESVTYDYLWNEGFDLVTSVEYNSENLHAKGILVSDPYLSGRKVIVSKLDLNFTDDAALTVALSSGSQTIKKMLHKTYPNFSIIDYPSLEECLNAVNRGEADILIQNQLVVEHWLHKPVYENLKVFPVLDLDERLCFSAVLPLEEKDGSELWRQGQTLIKILNKTIAHLSEDEIANYIVKASLENQYQYTLTDFLYRYRYMILVISLAAVLALTLIYMLFRLYLRSVTDRANSRARDTFLSTMSHEIRTPLNGLIGLNQLMSQNISDRTKLAGYLEQSSAISKYLLALVNDIFEMAKLQEHAIKEDVCLMNLDLLMSTITSIEQPSMEHKNITFQMDARIPYPDILGDEIHIQQIILSILDNAIKFTPEGGRITVTVRQSLTTASILSNTIDITDTGCGMTKEFQNKIFDSFTQERTTVSKGNQGTGLGMAISFHLAKLMGGNLSVKSKKGEGSCFSFVFPATLAASSTNDAPDAKAYPRTLEKKPGFRILIAEDNELNAEILIDFLTAEGFDVVLAENGKKAVELFSQSLEGEYKVILMDLLMPEMDGIEATKAIRALNRSDAKTVQIFACTANTFQEDRDRALKSGMNDFITKPIHIETLLQKLEQLS